MATKCFIDLGVFSIELLAGDVGGKNNGGNVFWEFDFIITQN